MPLIGATSRRLGLLGALALSLLAPGVASGALIGPGPTEPRPTAPPAIKSEAVTGITETDATVEATIDTQGGYTGYEIQVDTTGSFDFSGPVCPFALPGTAQCDAYRLGETMPGGALPRPEYIKGSSSPTTVSVDLAKLGVRLSPNTTYHARVIADGYGGGAQGADTTFTTPPGNPTSPTSLPPEGPGGKEEGPGGAPVQGPPAGGGPTPPDQPATPPAGGGTAPPAQGAPPAAGGDAPAAGATTPTAGATPPRADVRARGARGQSAKARQARAQRRLARALKVCRRGPAATRRQCMRSARASYRRTLRRIAG